MRICHTCWKNIKENPGYTIHRKNSDESYLICEKCKDSSLVEDLVKSNRWELIKNENNM